MKFVENPMTNALEKEVKIKRGISEDKRKSSHPIRMKTNRCKCVVRIPKTSIEVTFMRKTGLTSFGSLVKTLNITSEQYAAHPMN